MCGIVGAISNDRNNINTMLDCIHHRGPDGYGTYHDYNFKNKFHIQFGHKRLEIIDLSENASQPFLTLNESYVITFNGEIYNYKDLKKKYLNELTFKSESDTEVIIELYRKFGVKSFAWLKGMFAFAIYDKTINSVFLVRDSLGIKPLYFYSNDKELYFSSEIKSLKSLKKVDLSICNDSICEFLLNGFVYEPNTGFKNINKVFPGSFIEFSLNNKITSKKEKYWIPSKKNNISNKNSIKNLLDLINKEYKNHLVSDVPIGLFYSGGIDSSVLLALGDKTTTPYFIDSPAKNNKDLIYANLIADKLKKKFKILHFNKSSKNADEILKSIKYVAKHSEELMADFTFTVSDEISKRAKKNGHKVMLSGMGGDEMFLGYPRYKLVYYERIYKLFNVFLKPILYKFNFFSKKIERFNSFFEKKEFVLRYSNLIGYFNEKDLKKIIKGFDTKQIEKYVLKLDNFIDPYRNYSKTKQAQILDLYGFLSHNFMVADKSSMLSGVEIRVPLATPEIFNFNLSLKTKYFINLFNQKIPLLKILETVLPLKYFNRPKQGFNPDLDFIIDKIGEDRLLEVFNSIKFSKIVSCDFAKELIYQHFNDKKNNSYKIYQLLYFKYWIDYNFEV